MRDQRRKLRIDIGIIPMLIVIFLFEFPGPEPFLLYLDKREIRRYDIKTHETSTVISHLTNAIGLDFDWKEQMIYWSDVNEDQIEKAFLNGTGREVVISSGLIAAEGE